MGDASLGMKKKIVQIVRLFYLYIPTFIQTTCVHVMIFLQF